MKLYIWDRGWSGASMTFAKDREAANKILVDPIIEAEKRGWAQHNGWYEVPESPLYEPGRFNPNDWENTLRKRDLWLDEYDIVEGAIIDTHGE